MARDIARTVEVGSEVVHAAPWPGLTFCPCCDKTQVEFTPADRVARDPDEVTCGQFSAVDERILMESAGN